MPFQTQTVDLGEFDLDRFLAQQRLALQAPKAKKKKGFLLDQVSTGGGIGGALAGGAAGAAIGSAVPVVGTAVGGILGALLGGAAGSAGGEVVENKITGDQWDKNVANEALLGGLTSLPIGAGLKLAQAGLKAGTGIGKTGVRELIDQAGAKVVPGSVQTAAKAGAATKTGKRVEDFGAKMMASQSQLTGAQARQMGIRPVETMKRINQRTGLSNLDDMAEVSRGLTGNGADSILDTLTRASVDSTNGVALGDLRSMASKLIDDKGSLLSGPERKRLLDQVKYAATTMHGGSEGSLSTLANPSKALDQANAFRGTARELTNSFTATPAQKQQAKIYNDLAKHLEDSIYKSPGVNESIPMLAKAGSDDLFLRAQELRAAGNHAQANAYQKIGEEVFNVKNVKDLRKLKKDFVDIGKIDNATAQAQGARAFNSEDAMSLIRKNPVTGGLGLAMNAAIPRAASTVMKAGRAAQAGAGKAARTNQALLPLAARQGAARVLTTPQDTSDPSLDPTMTADAQFGLDPTTDTGAVAPEPSIGGYTKSQLEAAMIRAASDPHGQDAFDQLKVLYSLLPQDQGANLSSSTAQLAAKQATGSTALDQLEGAFQAAGGGQGSIGGGIAQILGNLNINPAAGTYNDQIAGTARQLSRAMGETGAGSDSDAQAYISMLPRLTDSPERAAQKIALLRQRLAAARQNTLLYGSGASDQFGANA